MTVARLPEQPIEDRLDSSCFEIVRPGAEPPEPDAAGSAGWTETARSIYAVPPPPVWPRVFPPL